MYRKLMPVMAIVLMIGSMFGVGTASADITGTASMPVSDGGVTPLHY